MSALTASASSSIHTMDNPQQLSPSSPTASLQNQQVLPARAYSNLGTPVRGQNNAFPSTPSSASQSGGILDAPPGMAYKDFVSTWTDAHVMRWLTDIKCGDHGPSFKANDIRGDILLELDQVTLKEMGVSSIGDRLRIVNAVKNLRQKCAAKPTASASPVPPTSSPALRPRLIVNGDVGHERNSSSEDGQSQKLDTISPTSRLASRSGRPAPLQLNGTPNRSDLPRLVREQSAPDSAASSRSNQVRPLPQPTAGGAGQNGASAANRQNLPPLPPAPRGTPPPAPAANRAAARALLNNTGRRTPTQADLPSYANSPLPPAPQNSGLLTPGTANSQSGWTGGYGLPSDPRAGNPGKPPARSTSPLPPNAPSGRNAARSPSSTNATHGRNASLGVNSPSTNSPSYKVPPRPSTSNSVVGQSTNAHTPANLQTNLSPIAESFTGQSASTPISSTPPQAFAVGKGPFHRPTTPSHAPTQSLDNIRHLNIVKFELEEEGQTSKINVSDCAGGVEVLEKVLKKFGKTDPRLADVDVMERVSYDGGGMSLDGWGAFLSNGPVSTTCLSEAELASICRADPNDISRQQPIAIRRIGGPAGRAKRTKALEQIFGEKPPLPGLRGESPTTPPPDGDSGQPSPRSLLSFSDSEAQTKKNTKRASTVSILSGLGVQVDAPPSPSHLSSKSPGEPTSAKKPSKLRNFFGQRPPSELITTHLADYFPFTEKRVLERTARNSMLRPVRLSGLSSRDSTAFNPPSRFSSSTVGTRTSISPSRRTSYSSPPPPPPSKLPVQTDAASPSAEDAPPRVSLSTDDGRSVELNADATPKPNGDVPPHLLPPVKFPSQSFTETMETLTGGQRPSRPGSRAMSIGSRRMSYMTELRSKRDRSDTASFMTVDQITAEVESKRESMMVGDKMTDGEDWTKIGESEDDEEAEKSARTVSAEEGEKVDAEHSEEEDESEYDDADEMDGETLEAEEEDETGKKQTSSKNATKWIKGALIGAGSFGKVYLGMDASNGLLMAVKQVELPTGSAPNEERKKSMLSALEREIDLLKDLQHDNIVQYLYSSLEEDYLNIFLEYVPGGSVTALLRNYGAFEEPLVKNFVRQILEGLNYLHQRDIIHRDIKGANILVDNKGGVKISDFGISKKVEDNLLTPKRVHRPSLQGSVFWMAPEVVKQTAHTQKADIWSVGCLVVEMLTGEHPWGALTQMQAIFKIGSSAKPKIPSDISAEAEDFLLKTFEMNHTARPSAEELLQHAWISGSSKPAGKGH